MGKKKTIEEFITDCELVHPNKFIYDNVVYINNKTYIDIICKKHGIFKSKPNWLLCGRGCSKCSNELNADVLRSKDYINNFIMVHKDKYDYSKVNYVNNKTRVEIICREHGSFFIKPNAHINGNGCPKCLNYVRDIDDFIRLSNTIHNNKYDYSKSIYIDSHTKIEIICKEHGSFFINPCDHKTQRQGCPECGKTKSSNNRRKPINKYIEECNLLFNNLYDYSKIEYINNKSNIIIVCKEHGEFNQIAKHHLNGRGCPKCSSSHGERRIISYLNNKNIEYIHQHKYDDCLSNNNYPLRFDFYLPNYNICIEYDGEQHFKPIKHFGGEESFNVSIERDNIKNKYCLEHNIGLIRIPFNKFKNIEDIISKSINNI